MKKKLIYIISVFLVWTNCVQSQELLIKSDSLLRNGDKSVKIPSPLEIDTCLNAWLGGVYNDSILINSSDSIGNAIIASGSVVNSQLDSSAILNMKSLDSVFWNKKCYLGNPYSLPEIWDFPFYYFNVDSPWNWKCYELQYRRIDAQLYDRSYANRFYSRFNYFHAGEKMERFFFYKNQITTSDTSRIRDYCWIRPQFLGKNIAINGGGVNTTDWEDSNLDGLADFWSKSNGTASIIQGSGFVGNAQRIDVSVPGTQNSLNFSNLEIGKTYEFTFKYRASSGIQMQLGFSEIGILPANTGVPLFTSHTITPTSTIGLFRVTFSGDWFEVDEINIKQVCIDKYRKETL